jgi:hypothetical protein
MCRHTNITTLLVTVTGALLRLCWVEAAASVAWSRSHVWKHDSFSRSSTFTSDDYFLASRLHIHS